jgi:hypothetical protein
MTFDSAAQCGGPTKSAAIVEQKPLGFQVRLISFFAPRVLYAARVSVAKLEQQSEPAAPALNASVKEVMGHRLKTQVGQSLCKLRQQTAEPVFGVLKSVLENCYRCAQGLGWKMESKNSFILAA